MQQTISVFGLGYVGCVSAACLAQAGFQVIGVEIDAEKVRMINEGKSPVVEPGLEELISRMVGNGRLRATTRMPDVSRSSRCTSRGRTPNSSPQLSSIPSICRLVFEPPCTASPAGLSSTKISSS